MALEELNIKGLVKVFKNKKHLLYTPVNPKRIIEIAKIRTKRIEEIIPDLFAFYRESPRKPVVQIYEGKENIEAICKESFDWLNTERELLIIGAISQFKNYEYLIDLFEKKIKQGKGGYKARELNNDDEYSRLYYKRMKKYISANYQLKMLSSENNFINCDMFIFDEKIFIFSHSPDLFAISIEAKNVVLSFRRLFEFAWRSVLPISI
ncbi:MAG: hypothetical protein V1655_03440 [bacterium]